MDREPAVARAGSLCPLSRAGPGGLEVVGRSRSSALSSCTCVGRSARVILPILGAGERRHWRAASSAPGAGRGGGQLIGSFALSLCTTKAAFSSSGTSLRCASMSSIASRPARAGRLGDGLVQVRVGLVDQESVEAAAGREQHQQHQAPQRRRRPRGAGGVGQVRREGRVRSCASRAGYGSCGTRGPRVLGDRFRRWQHLGRRRRRAATSHRRKPRSVPSAMGLAVEGAAVVLTVRADRIDDYSIGQLAIGTSVGRHRGGAAPPGGRPAPAPSSPPSVPYPGGSASGPDRRRHREVGPVTAEGFRGLGQGAEHEIAPRVVRESGQLPLLIEILFKLEAIDFLVLGLAPCDFHRRVKGAEQGRLTPAKPEGNNHRRARRGYRSRIACWRSTLRISSTPRVDAASRSPRRAYSSSGWRRPRPAGAVSRQVPRQTGRPCPRTLGGLRGDGVEGDAEQECE